MEYIPFKLSFKTDPSRLFRTESTMHPWYSFNFGKCKSCLTVHSSGPSCWAFSILILLHHTCALLARSIYHSYPTGMSIRLLNRKLLGALNSCTIHHTGLHPLLTRPPTVTTIQILKRALRISRFRNSRCKEFCFPRLPKSENPKDQG
jgi:hypothetical protein